MKTKLIALTATTALILLGLSGYYVYTEAYPNYRVQELVKATLKDPSSANFRAITVHKDTGQACGLVNAKNSLGGYTGEREFVVKKTGTVEFTPNQSLPDCTKPNNPQIPEISMNNPMEASLIFSRSVERFKVQTNQYIACLNQQSSIVEASQAFLEKYAKLCAESSGN